MTRERAKELLPVIQAFSEGKSIQCRTRAPNLWERSEDPGFLSGFEYRIKPETKLRPFTQAEACKFRLFRYSSTTEIMSPIVFKASGLVFNPTRYEEYEVLLMRGWKCSNDGINWKRCGVEVES